jgi:methyl-accepting chemotaxis protein
MTSIRSKILTAFLFSLGLVIVGGGIGIYGLLGALSKYRTEVSTLELAQSGVLRTETHFKIQVQEWKNVLLRGKDPEKLDKYWKGFEKEEKAVATEASALASLLDDAEAKKLLTDFVAAHKQLGEGYRKGLVAFKEAGGDAFVGDKAVSGIDRLPTQLLDKAVERIDAIAEVAAKSADNAAQTSLIVATVAIVVGILIGLAVFMSLIQKQIVSPAAVLVRELDVLTSGNLAQSIRVDVLGEIGQLASGIETLRKQLVSVIGTAKSSSTAVHTGTSELRMATVEVRDSADRASDTAVNLAAAMEEMLTSIEQIAGNSVQVADEAGKARENVEFSREVVQRLLGDVHGIDGDLAATTTVVAKFVESAREIAGLTQQVKEIAEQTNLLALNAAIEAARAGEQGRGFAVVADEVRKLAEKSAKSANEIDLVTHQLEQGTIEVERTIAEGHLRLSATAAKSQEVSNSLDNAIAGVQTATQSVEQIASAIQEQRSAINGVASQSENLARMAEENASVANQIQGNAEQMSRFSEQLQQSLASFRT